VESRRVAAIPFFAGLPDAELAVVARLASELEVATGEAITNEGDFGHALFAIESGTADVVRDGTTLRAVGLGDVVGEVAVLVSGRRTASVVATSPMRVVVLFKRDVWALDREAPEAARRLSGVLAERVERALD
jgi:CPA1 family monovalent cation:H+ antiporter